MIALGLRFRLCERAIGAQFLQPFLAHRKQPDRNALRNASSDY